MTIQDLEQAISQLSQKELTEFRAWFAGFDAEAWDKQLQNDVAAGRLDSLADEALRDLREGRTTAL